MTQEAYRLRNSIFFVFTFTLMLWLVKALEWAVAMDFGFLGILPRTLSGTMGIVTAPLIHGDVLHLLSNTFPLLLLGVSVFYFYDRIALEVFVWIYFMSGFWVWMAAREAYHIGASGLVYGLVSFLFFSGLFRRDVRSLSISLIVIFLYGGMVQGLFPFNERISWESHLLGALAGAFCAFFYRDIRMAEQEQENPELVPAMVGGGNAAVSYQQMQQAVDMFDAGNLVIEPKYAEPAAEQLITLSYTYCPNIKSEANVSKRTVVPYGFLNRNLTDNRFVFHGDNRLNKNKGNKKETDGGFTNAAA